MGQLQVADLVLQPQSANFCLIISFGECRKELSLRVKQNWCHPDKMHLMYNEDPVTGKRVYTLKKVLDGVVTKSAHPARFSPDDKYSRQRVTLKKRYGLLLTQQKESKKEKYHKKTLSETSQ